MGGREREFLFPCYSCFWVSNFSFCAFSFLLFASLISPTGSKGGGGGFTLGGNYSDLWKEGALHFWIPWPRVPGNIQLDLLTKNWGTFHHHHYNHHHRHYHYHHHYRNQDHDHYRRQYHHCLIIITVKNRQVIIHEVLLGTDRPTSLSDRPKNDLTYEGMTKLLLS